MKFDKNNEIESYSFIDNLIKDKKVVELKEELSDIRKLVRKEIEYLTNYIDKSHISSKITKNIEENKKTISYILKKSKEAWFDLDEDIL